MKSNKTKKRLLVLLGGLFLLALCVLALALFTHQDGLEELCSSDPQVHYSRTCSYGRVGTLVE